MKRTMKIAIVAAAVAAIGATAFAAAVAHERGGGHMRWMQGGHGGYGMHGGGYGRHGGGMRMMEAYDTDGDGRLTQEEVDQARAAQLKKFDKDGDGMLSIGEYEALWLDAMRERMVDQFQEHDADGDGKVTQEEFGSRHARMIKRMDRNGDGVFDEEDRGGRWRHRDDDDDDDERDKDK